MGASELRRFKAVVGSTVINAGFGQPTFEILTAHAIPVAMRAMHSALAPRGLKLGDITVERPSNAPASAYFEMQLANWRTQIRVGMERIELTHLDSSPAGQSTAFELAALVQTALERELSISKTGSVQTELRHHCEPNDESSKETLGYVTEFLQRRRLNLEQAMGMGALSGAGLSLYFGPPTWVPGIANWVLTAEPSLQVPGGLFFSVRTLWSETDLVTLRERATRHHGEAFSAFNWIVSSS